MIRFDVCRARGPGVAVRERLVVVLQHEVLADLATVIVAPIYTPTELPRLERLRPTVELGGQPFVVAIDRLVSIPVKHLSLPLHNLGAHRMEFLAAVDLLFSGF